MAKKSGKDTYKEGSWYGNDTIWRTIVDLNRILFYCNKEGKLNTDRQRIEFNIGDMIISGEKEGPLMPSPKRMGILIMGVNPVAFDSVIADIMGFDYKKIPSIYNNYQKDKLPLIDFDKSEIEVVTNNIEVMKPQKSFIATNGWIGHIEKDFQTSK